MRVLSVIAAVSAALLASTSAISLDSNAKMYGINYDRRQAPDWDPAKCKTEEQVIADFQAIAQIANSVRLYGLSDRDECHTRHELKAAKTAKIKVALGMWTGLTAKDFASELGRLDGLLRAGLIDDNVMGLHVGSEALLRGEYTAATAIDYLNQVKTLLQSYKNPLKVTITDVTDSYYKNPSLVKAVDYVSINHFSFWEKANVKDGMAVVLDRIRLIRSQAEALGKDVVISETGWASGGQDKRCSVTSLDNQKQFFQDFYHQAIAQNIPYYWFSAFQADWMKVLSVNVSSPVEPYFGVLQTDRTLKSSFTNLDLKPRNVVKFQAAGRYLTETVDPNNLRNVNGVALSLESTLTTKLSKFQNQWFFNTNTGQIRSLNSDRCLQAASGVNGAAITTTSCVATEPAQKWAYDATTKRISHVTFTGFCLDYVTNNNYLLELYKCSSTSKNQNWDVTGLPTQPPVTTPPPTTKPVVTTATPPPTTTKPVVTATAPPPWAAGTVAPPNFDEPKQSTTNAVRFITKQTYGKQFAQLIRNGDSVAVGFGTSVAGADWVYDPSTNLIKSKDSNYCLDAYEPWNAGRVHVWACNPQEKNQKWNYDASTGQLKHLTHTGFCLDGDLAGNNGNGVIQLYGCHLNNNNQVWRKVSSAAVAVRITNKDSSVVELADRETQSGKAVVTPTADKQVWFWNSATGKVVNKWNGECLDAYEPKNLGRVHTWDCIDTEVNQKWKYVNGQLQHATHSGYCLAYTSTTTKSLVLKSCSTSDATQAFAFTEVNA